MSKRTFYRVCHKDTLQGLWYDELGNFTGLIHEDLNFCTNNALVMEFDQDLVGWLSVTDNLETLYKWFTKKDIIKLQEHGWFVHIFESEVYKFYDKFQHEVISQKHSKLINIIII